MAVPTIDGATDPPSFVASTGSDLTVTMPTGEPDSGDLVIVLEELADGTTLASDGTLISSGYTKLWGDGHSGATGASWGMAWAKVADGTETDVQLEGTLKNHICAGILVISNHGVSDPATDIVVGTSATLNGSAAMTIPGITADADSLLVLCTAYTDDQLDADSVTWSHASLTITEQFDEASNVGAGGGVALATAPFAAGGSTGDFTATHDTTSQFEGVLLGIPPAGGGPAPTVKFMAIIVGA